MINTFILDRTLYKLTKNYSHIDRFFETGVCDLMNYLNNNSLKKDEDGGKALTYHKLWEHLKK